MTHPYSARCRPSSHTTTPPQRYRLLPPVTARHPTSPLVTPRPSAHRRTSRQPHTLSLAGLKPLARWERPSGVCPNVSMLQRPFQGQGVLCAVVSPGHRLQRSVLYGNASNQNASKVSFYLVFKLSLSYFCPLELFASLRSAISQEAGLEVGCVLEGVGDTMDVEYAESVGGDGGFTTDEEDGEDPVQDGSTGRRFNNLEAAQREVVTQ
ncbi:MAG TPA: hypothetical protein VGO47_09885 [Chlamydiales bacterium]|nr:hypothetical protein [Chlamydiales bacterium]